MAGWNTAINYARLVLLFTVGGSRQRLGSLRVQNWCLVAGWCLLQQSVHRTVASKVYFLFAAVVRPTNDHQERRILIKTIKLIRTLWRKRRPGFLDEVAGVLTQPTKDAVRTRVKRKHRKGEKSKMDKESARVAKICSTE